MVVFALMSKLTTIHQGKQPIRRHYIAEWLEERRMTATDLLEALNDPDRSSEYPFIDKSQVYRWLKGQLPQPAMQLRIAAALGFEADPGKLLRPPELDWIKEFFDGRSREEMARIRDTLTVAFPRQKTDESDIREQIDELPRKSQQVAKAVAGTSAARLRMSRSKSNQGN